MRRRKKRRHIAGNAIPFGISVVCGYIFLTQACKHWFGTFFAGTYHHLRVQVVYAGTSIFSVAKPAKKCAAFYAVFRDGVFYKRLQLGPGFSAYIFKPFYVCFMNNQKVVFCAFVRICIFSNYPMGCFGEYWVRMVGCKISRAKGAHAILHDFRYYLAVMAVWSFCSIIVVYESFCHI